MVKIVPISNTTAGFNSATKINESFDKVETAFNNTLSRDGSLPNAMEADLDMNNNDVINVKSISTGSLVLGGLTQTPSNLVSTDAEVVVENVAAITSNTSLLTGMRVRTLGYFAAHDGGGAEYEITTNALFAATPNGITDHQVTGGTLVAVLQAGREMKAEYAGVVLSDGLPVARGDRFNEAFWYAIENGLNFSAHSDFKTRAPLEWTTRAGGTFEDTDINCSCTITAQSGGGFTTGGTLANGTVYGAHSQSRPIPMVYFKGGNNKVRWPRLECENVCAGVKLKVNTANVHLYPEVRGFSRYGWWPVGNNDSKTFEPLIKQMYRDPDWMTSVGLDPLDWSEWNGDCIIISTKDFMFTSGQIGWGGPGVRFLDGLPVDNADRIPGRNCYWCGLSPSTSYLDGDNGAGDVMMPDLHIMQGISNTAFLDIGAGPRTGAWMDHDLATGQQVIRVTDSCIGVLSFCAVSNLSFMEGLDNDSCVHFLYGAQVEFATERPGSSGSTQTTETQTVHILDPRVRVFASLGAGGGSRYPFMTSMHRMRHMCIGFHDDDVTPQTVFTAGGVMDGSAFLATHQAAIEAANVPHMIYVPATGLTDVGDGVHWNGASLVTLGERHASAALTRLLRVPSTAPVVILGAGQSNLVGNTAATDGSHTIESGVYVWNGSINDGPGTAFIPAAFGSIPFNRGVDPWANNLLVHMANDIKTATGRDVYIILQGKGARNLESFLLPATNTANGWTADEDLSALYTEVAAALALVPGRTAIAPDVIAWQQGEANSADSSAVYASKLEALVSDLTSQGLYNPAIQWNGNWDEWNKLNRASGTYGGQQRYRGFISEPTATGPTLPMRGDYWVVQGSISFTTGAGPVTATDGQLLWAIADLPSSPSDWLVVDADSAPLRDTKAFETEARAHQTIVYPGDDEGVPQRTMLTPGAFFRERWGFTGSTETVTSSWNGVEYRIEATTGPTNLYLDGVDTGLSVNGATMTFVNSGTETWQMLETNSVLRPVVDNVAQFGADGKRPSASFLRSINAIIPTYANNAAAIVGGLVVNDVYKVVTGEVRIVV